MVFVSANLRKLGKSVIATANPFDIWGHERSMSNHKMGTSWTRPSRRKMLLLRISSLIVSTSLEELTIHLWP